jgi:hypothetical protein
MVPSTYLRIVTKGNPQTWHLCILWLQYGVDLCPSGLCVIIRTLQALHQGSWHSPLGTAERGAYVCLIC